MNNIPSSKQQVKSMWRQIATQILLALIFMAIGIIFEWLFNHNKLSAQIEPVIIRDQDAQYSLIDPLIGIDFPGKINFPELQKLKTDMKNFIAQQQTNGNVIRVSVYYRNADNAHWIGINEDDKFHPASLLKVPYMMAYLKQAEIQPQLLNEKIFYSGKNHNTTDQVQHLAANKYYTVSELINAMIQESDNDAKDLLVDNMNPDVIAETFNDLGLWPQDVAIDTISPRSYTIFLRTLYSATLLSRPMSEYALDLLTKTDFKDGLVAGTPTNVVVAHKFGEYANTEENKAISIELHDCGIIYYPNNRYYLCIMTAGYNRDDLANVIKGISSIAYSDSH